MDILNQTRDIYYIRSNRTYFFLLSFQILLTGIDAIERINQSGADNGTSSSNGPGHIEGSLVIRCKNLKIFQIDIRGYEKFKSIAESLDKLLSATVPERSKSERSDSLIVSRISFDQVPTNGFDKIYRTENILL